MPITQMLPKKQSVSERALRFGVSNDIGQRSESWKCWTVSGKNDVYLLCRALGDAIKLSLHESGRWHVGFGSPELFDKESLPQSRFLGVWEKPVPITGAYTLACKIHVPFESVSMVVKADDDTIHWETCAPSGNAVEFAIFITDRPYYGPALCQLISPRPKLIGTIPLGRGGRAIIVSYVRPKIILNQPPNVKPSYFKGMGREEMLQGNRALLWNAMEDGSIMFVETPVKILSND